MLKVGTYKGHFIFSLLVLAFVVEESKYSRRTRLEQIAVKQSILSDQEVMNWGSRKKTFASSMTGRGMSSVTNMFPISWISKLRQWNENKNYHRSETRINERKMKDVKMNPWLQNEEDKRRKVEKFHGETDNNFWRLSFSDECVQGMKSVRGCPESYEWLDETKFSLSASTCRSYGAKGVSKFDSLKDTDKKVAEGYSDSQHLPVKDIAEVEAVKPMQTAIRISRGSPSSLHSQQQHYEASKHSKLQSSECKNLGEVSLSELSLVAGEGRKSIYINKDSLKRGSKNSGRSSKVKVYSPRTPSKIRALDDLKKSRMKMRVRKKVEQEKTVLESLAVVKRTFNPQKDFRNSMLEMILNKGISHPKELEELLACYLILNSDEYHDMIIKVFRQVWFDLNKDRLDS